ncbi:MAG: DUF559 domain-containing protein [Solirubrobacteraceae bacterium]
MTALDARDVRLRYGIPLTAPARTAIDYAATATGAELERAVAEARVLKLFSDGELKAAIERAPLRSGAHPRAFDRDRRRDQVLQAAGYHVIRVAWRQLQREPIGVAARIGQTLARAAAGA